MIAVIRERLKMVPFEPFYILTSGGNRYRVATADHASINPRGTRIIVWFDDDGDVEMSALHIVAVEKEAPLPTQADS